MRGPTVNYCETPTNFILKRPFYALSNFALIIAGVVILKKSKSSNSSKFFGYSSIAMGIFSLLYDATYLYLFQLLDLAVMFTFVSIILYLNLSKLLTARRSHIVAFLAILLLISFSLILYLKGGIQNMIFAFYVSSIIITTSLLIMRGVATNSGYLLTALIMFITGFAFWSLDYFKIYCDPTNILNGRSIFHIFASVSIFYLSLFYNALKSNGT